MADPVLFCSRCWLEQTQKRPLPPCRRCSSVHFTPDLDREKRDAVLAAAWPIGITDADVKFLRSMRLSAGDTYHGKGTKT